MASRVRCDLHANSLKWDFLDFVSLGIFGVAGMTHIIKDCKQRRLAQIELENLVKMEQAAEDSADRALAAKTSENILKAALNGCEVSSSSMIYGRHC